VSSALAVEAERADERVLNLDLRRDGVAVLTLAAAGRRSNTVTQALCAQLSGVLDRTERDPGIAAIVIASAKSGFAEGTPAHTFKAIKFAADAERFAREVSGTFHRIAALRKPAVAAVHGGAIGGGFELALAAHAIVASDHPSTSFALPEVRLGLIPSGNGVLRMAQRAGLRTAIEFATRGGTAGAAAAFRARLIDDVCPESILLEVAARRAKSLVGRVQPEPSRPRASLMEHNALARAVIFRAVRRELLARTHGHYPAPERVVDILERFASRGFESAAELEARAFGELVVSETAHRLIEVFYATRDLARDRGQEERSEPRHAQANVERIAVLGGGRIGTGVAYASVVAGIGVRLKEADHARSARAVRGVRALVEERAAAFDAAATSRDAACARLSTTTDCTGLRIVDLVVEAVPESLPLKQSMVRDVERAVEPTCVLASTTTSIPVAQIAQVAARPERVLGMHYIHPAWKVRLVEIVRADKTAPWAVATAVALAKKQGKTPVVVRDSPGFFVTRVLAPYLAEAALMVGEGAAIEYVDSALVDWGFPVGPLELLDEIGLDVSAGVAQMLHTAFPERMNPPSVVTRLVADDRLGRAHGRGFFRYDARPVARRSADPTVYSVLGVSPTGRLPVEEIQMRCALALINESVRCVGELVVRSPRDADVAAILGLGFPRFRGGPLRYLDAIGAAETLRRIQSFADRYGERWRPAPLLVHMARKGDRFYA
jgi:3-hydroxyacyl-CoA dehydrogenase/enoyl-CoA hydratase/3-hydroxybutyryl-CoA epimerase